MSEKESVSTDGMGGERLIYQTEDGNIKLQARLENETIWLAQQMIAELFQRPFLTLVCILKIYMKKKNY